MIYPSREHHVYGGDYMYLWWLWGLRFYPTCKLVNSSVTISWKVEETQDSWVRDKGCCHSKHNKQHEHHHVCVGFSWSCMKVMWKGPDTCNAHSGFVLQLKNTKLGKSIIFIASSKQTCSLFQRQPLYHFSRSLSVNVILRNGSSKEQSELSIFDKLSKMCSSPRDI